MVSWHLGHLNDETDRAEAKAKAKAARDAKAKNAAQAAVLAAVHQLVIGRGWEATAAIRAY